MLFLRVLSFLCLTGFVQAQNARLLDSLRAALPLQPDTTQTLTYADLCWESGEADLNQARKFGQTGLDLARRIGFRRGEFENLRSLGAIHARRSNYPLALDYFLKALPVAESIGETASLARVLKNVGMIHNALHEPAKSLPYYQRALAIHERAANRRGRADVLYSLAEVYIKLKQYDRGLAASRECMAIYKDEKQPHDYALALSEYGWALLQQERFAEAIPPLTQALRRLEAEHYSYGVGNLQNNLAEAYYETGDYVTSEQYARNALATLTPTGIWSEIKNAEKHLYQVYSVQGDKVNARRHFAAFEAAQDSVFGRERSQAVAEVETRYQTQLKDQAIVGLTRQNSLQRYLTYLALAGVFLLLAVSGLLYNRYRLRSREKRAVEQQRETERELSRVQQENLHLELDHKNRELATSALFSFQKNELLSDLKDKVSELMSGADKAQRPQITAIQKAIQSHLHFDDEWEAFQLRFEQVHPRFFEHLQSQFPDLTPNELKLCAYTRINLSNKEIARLLNINTSSVEMSRYRLKKKLNLDPQMSLTEFIQKQ
ncbi:MAG: tetratricopeptide repeat protein [Sphingobacteriaceae bacterium]|nr:tetratricopeptide repeat protein [Cytophagaceae bacterium]